VVHIPSQSKEALMSRLLVQVKRSTLPVLIVVCLASLTASYAFANDAQRPLATQVIGDPDAAVTGKFAVGTAAPGNKALTVVGVIDFLGAGTVHNYFTQGGGNNMQINTNVDETNTVGDATKSQWKLVMGSSLNWFSIRRSPAGATYNEDALFFIDGSTGNVGIAKVDTANLATIPLTPPSRLYVETDSGDAIRGVATNTADTGVGVYGRTDSTNGSAMYAYASATSGTTYGVFAVNPSTSGRGVYGLANAGNGVTYGVMGQSSSSSGTGMYGWASAASGTTYGVYGQSDSGTGRGVYGLANKSTGTGVGVYGQSASGAGTGVYGWATATNGTGYGVYGQSDSSAGRGMYGLASAASGTTYGAWAQSISTSGTGVYGLASAASGTTYGVYGESDSTSGYGVFGWATAATLGKGVEGRSDATNGTGVFGYAPSTTGGNLGVVGLTNSASGYGVEGVAAALTGVNVGVYGMANSASGYGVYSQGNMHVVGDFSASGTKSAIVETQDYGWRNLYAMESPQSWFEDFGRATLSGGEAVVPIEQVFAQTVNLGETYHVFLTPLGGGCTLFVADQSSTAFTVRANEGSGCEIAFDYRIIAPRLNYEDLRLKPAEDPQVVAASVEAAATP
jgi:hypothetical protein